MTHKEFISTVYLNQGHSHIMLSGKASDKKEHIEFLFNLDHFRKLEAVAKRRLKEVEEKIEHLEATIELYFNDLRKRHLGFWFN